ncbi:MAG: hypothetical protein GX050_06420 [Firmicutes bacterium]|nr:hypothetical protein [Bacillota bacterium]
MEGIDWQLSTIAILFLTGLGWGLFYDLYLLVKPSKKQTHFSDFFFWIISLLLMAPVIFFANWGELRLYLWISLLMGVGCYRVAFRTSVYGFLKMSKRKLKRRRGYF